MMRDRNTNCNAMRPTKYQIISSMALPFASVIFSCVLTSAAPKPLGQKRTSGEVSRMFRHPLSEVRPDLTASTTMRMAWMTIGALSIMMLCPECVSVM